MKVVVLTRPPEAVPVIVTVTEAGGAVAAAVRVKVDVDAGLAGVIGLGVNADAVTPVGRPDMDNVTA